MVLPVSLMLAGICFAQNTNLEQAKRLLNEKKQDSLKTYINKINPKSLTTYLRGEYYEIIGVSNLQKDQHHLAFEAFQKAKKAYQLADSITKSVKINLHIIDLLAHQKNLNISPKSYINEYLSFAENSENLIDRANASATIALTYLEADDGKEAMYYFDKAIQEAFIAKDTILATDYLFNKGVVYNTILKDYDSALSIFKSVVPIYKKNNDLTYVAYSYNNQAEAYKKKGEYKNALAYYKKADSITLQKNNLKSKVLFYKNMISLFDSINDYKNGQLYSKKLINLKDSINDTKQNIAISEIKEQYDNEKLRADNLESEAKRKQNQNIAIGLAGSIVLGAIIVFLLFKNAKRKQKLAEQDKALETQKLATVLKEQELTSIDAMIEGQEKERQRIANDLHDDLGSLMATVKLHFNALKDKNTPELYTKTNALIDQAYQKIRSIAHAKNSGVIAKQGLLKAIQDMAEKISDSNKITIDVVDHGLENRLENSLELTVFRIVQELITNVIKHAEASEVTIHITNHDESLNIMVEDNGKGFNPNQITKTNKGMGISSIDKRVTHLDGTMTIESDKTQGTTIIIDIPI